MQTKRMGYLQHLLQLLCPSQGKMSGYLVVLGIPVCQLVLHHCLGIGMMIFQLQALQDMFPGAVIIQMRSQCRIIMLKLLKSCVLERLLIFNLKHFQQVGLGSSDKRFVVKLRFSSLRFQPITMTGAFYPYMPDHHFQQKHLMK